MRGFGVWLVGGSVLSQIQGRNGLGQTLGGSGFGRFAGRGFGGQLCCPLVNT